MHPPHTFPLLDPLTAGEKTWAASQGAPKNVVLPKN